jgi:hypothetical protein
VDGAVSAPRYQEITNGEGNVFHSGEGIRLLLAASHCASCLTLLLVLILIPEQPLLDTDVVLGIVMIVAAAVRFREESDRGCRGYGSHNRGSGDGLL